DHQCRVQGKADLGGTYASGAFLKADRIPAIRRVPQNRCEPLHTLPESCRFLEEREVPWYLAAFRNPFVGIAGDRSSFKCSQSIPMPVTNYSLTSNTSGGIRAGMKIRLSHPLALAVLAL